MKRIIILFGIFMIGLIWITPPPGAAKVKPDFRKAFWGMSREEVMATEKLQPVKVQDDLIVYNGRIYEEPGEIVYRFAGGKLVKGEYSFSKPDQDLDYYREIAAKVDGETGVTKFEFVFTMINSNPENMDKFLNKPDGSEGRFGTYFRIQQNKVSLMFTGRKTGAGYRGKVSVEYELYENMKETE